MTALLPQSRLFNRLVLDNPQTPPDTHRDSPKAEALPADGRVPPEEAGQKGVALTDLRPVGKADFSGTTREVQTQGEYLERGTEIIVLRKEGLRLVVKGV